MNKFGQMDDDFETFTNSDVKLHFSFSHFEPIFFFSAGPIPLRVREAQVPVVNDNECVRKINAVTEKIFILPASSFCAGGEEGHDACQVSSR